MILSTDKKDVKKSQEFETINYGVSTDNLPLLFQMLRTNLYSDIYGSIIREVVSNVVDSHTEAEKNDAIGEIEWIDENRLLGVENQLIIRDFGVGLSPDRMRNIYGNYLSSTKRGDNSTIGGFGLGSKVPFAYTDSFFIETVYDGTKYKYLCYIDESQLGAISTLDITESDKPNGTEIIIPVKNRFDKQKFQEAIFRQLAYFKNLKFINISGPNGEILFEDNDCVVAKQPPYPGLHIVLGTVAYPIDLQAAGIDTWNDNVQNCGVGLKFGIGEIQPTISREQLFWNENVKKKVHAKLAIARKNIRVEIEKDLDNEKDYNKWWSFTIGKGSAKFPNQWHFAKVSTNAIFKPADGSAPLQIRQRVDEWYAGMSMKLVTRYTGYSSRRGTKISKTPEYSTSTPSYNDLSRVPVYQYEGTLSARKSLFLFKTNPGGFVVVNDLGLGGYTDSVQKDLTPYYTQAQLWRDTLPKFDDIDVPEDEFSTTSDDEYKEAYKKLLAQRKLEGKFTAKIVRRSDAYARKYDEAFAFAKYEGKFEEHKKGIVVYGLQDNEKLLLKLASILTFSQRFMDKQENLANVIILKVSQQNMKQFKMMQNAHEITEVFQMKTLLNKELGDIITAHKYEEAIDEYKILDSLSYVCTPISNSFKEVRTFVLAHTQKKHWHETGLLEEVIKLCEDAGITNTDIDDKFESISKYVEGAELLKYIQYKKEAEPYIKEYLIHKGKSVNFTKDMTEKAMKIAEKELVENLDEL